MQLWKAGKLKSNLNWTKLMLVFPPSAAVGKAADTPHFGALIMHFSYNLASYNGHWLFKIDCKFSVFCSATIRRRSSSIPITGLGLPTRPFDIAAADDHNHGSYRSPCQPMAAIKAKLQIPVIQRRRKFNRVLKQSLYASRIQLSMRALKGNPLILKMRFCRNAIIL